MTDSPPTGQPWFHDLVPTLRAPTQVWSATSGQIDGEGVSGCLHADVRVLSQAVVRVGGAQPLPVGHHVRAVDDVVFTSLARETVDGRADPYLRVERRREVVAGAVTETLELRTWTAGVRSVLVELDVACDLAPVDELKAGRRRPPVPPTAAADGLTWSSSDAGATTTVRLQAPGAEVDATAGPATLTWRADVARGAPAALTWTITAERSPAVLVGGSASPGGGRTDAPGWHRLVVHGDDPRWAPVLARSTSDIDGLLMAVAGSPDDAFVAAGAPWFLTLFGRDSLWAARMLMPFSTSLALSTLRALAAVQGTRRDPATGEAPGKIIHELRGTGFAIGSLPGDPVARSLPPVYYGAIDSTPLWVLTLADAWRWGLPDADVAALLPALQAALAWLVEAGDVDGDGLLEYVDESGTGLTNQGWKDSGDGIRHRDGSLPQAPLALCEVQGYAYAAARAGADLLDAFGAGGAGVYRDWAGRLRERFRRSFWVEDDVGPYPAVALDHRKAPVASLTSNAGHLLGTGLLHDGECATVARRMVAADMFSGFGIRTLSASGAGFSPLGYHVGTVWPHDTAIAVAGMVAEGAAAEALTVAVGLLDALHAFGGRPPELFCGDARETHPVPVPYPAACRPQGWSAAVACSLLTSVLGLRPDGDRLVAHPLQPWPFGAMTVRGVRVGARWFAVDVDVTGRATVTEDR